LPHGEQEIKLALQSLSARPSNFTWSKAFLLAGYARSPA